MSETLDEFSARRNREAKEYVAKVLNMLAEGGKVTPEQLDDESLEAIQTCFKYVVQAIDSGLRKKREESALNDFTKALLGGVPFG